MRHIHFPEKWNSLEMQPSELSKSVPQHFLHVNGNFKPSSALPWRLYMVRSLLQWEIKTITLYNPRHVIHGCVSINCFAHLWQLCHQHLHESSFSKEIEPTECADKERDLFQELTNLIVTCGLAQNLQGRSSGWRPREELQFKSEECLLAEFPLLPRKSVFYFSDLQLIRWGPPALCRAVCFAQSLFI